MTTILVSGSTRSVARASGQYPNTFGILLTPANRNSVESVVNTGLPWAIDNGAFSGFDAEKFRRLLQRAVGRPRLLWVVCPDVVGKARETLRLFTEWAYDITRAGFRIAFVGQDGLEDLDVPWQWFHTFFIGGSTRWKLSEAAADLATEAKSRQKWLHMGRVNTFRRLRYAVDLGCDSVDGSCFSRWEDKFLCWGARAVRRFQAQPSLFVERECKTVT